MSDLKNAVLVTTQKLLYPLIRILVRFGVSHLEFNDLVKKTYVEVCYRDFSLPGRSNSVSRVAVLTGLSRKEVLRLTKVIEQGEELEPDSKGSINRASRAIGGWLQDSKFHDIHGNPIVLSITGKDPSFKTLVKQYSGDITYGAILDELVRIKAVELIDNDSVKLLTNGYIPFTSDIEKIEILGISAKDLLTTIDHNIKHPDQPRFQRSVIYGELSQTGIEEFKLVSRDKCSDLLIELNQWLANKKSIEKRMGVLQPKSRVGIGLYYIEDEIAEGDSSAIKPDDQGPDR